MRLLLVEDEPVLARSICARLKRDGFSVDHFASLPEASEAVLAAEYRLVLLDRRLPEGDGLTLLPLMRSRSSSPPVIVLTAMDDVPDRVAGLDAGADDYLVKPFALDELMARVRVLLRRDGAPDSTPTVDVGRLSYDLSRHELRVAGRTVVVPRRELAILDALARRAGRVVMREHVEAQVYGYDDDISSNALDSHVSRLRKRLSDAGAEVEVHGIRGVGYMLKGS